MNQNKCAARVAQTLKICGVVIFSCLLFGCNEETSVPAEPLAGFDQQLAKLPGQIVCEEEIPTSAVVTSLDLPHPGPVPSIFSLVSYEGIGTFLTGLAGGCILSLAPEGDEVAPRQFLEELIYDELASVDQVSELLNQRITDAIESENLICGADPDQYLLDLRGLRSFAALLEIRSQPTSGEVPLCYLVFILSSTYFQYELDGSTRHVIVAGNTVIWE